MVKNHSSHHDEENLGKAYDYRLMKRLLRLAQPYWKFFFLAVLLLFGTTLSGLARPYIMKIAIDEHIAKGDVHALGKLSLLFVVVIVLGFILNFFQIYILSYAGQSIIYGLRQKLFSHLQKMPVSFFDSSPVGRLVTRVTNDTETLNDMYTNVLVSLLSDIFILAGASIIMLKMDVALGLITLATLPVIAVATVFFRIKAREVYRKVRTSLAGINSSFSENISGMRVIQLFSREKENFKEFSTVNDEAYKVGISEIVVFGIFRPFIEMLAFAAVALVLWYGGIHILDGTLQFGVLFAFVNYISQFFQPINDLAEKYNILQAAMASSERIFHLLDTPEEVDEGVQQISTSNLHGEIEFRNVWFAYTEEDWVLKDISFKVPAGQTVAIVGATGAGKSSIINLLGRFYEIQKGDIFIDGTNIRDIQKESLRKVIGIVLQDVFLFSGKIKDNIRLDNENITSEEIEKVAEYVNADHFIRQLPSGYDDEVKERGTSFSTGQRQLLAFARALAFNPSILILDEATSSIDTETELLIQDALGKITKNRTTIVIAHRLSTILNADNILVLHKGRIREAGTHQELLEKNGIYYNLYNLQYGENAQ